MNSRRRRIVENPLTAAEPVCGMSLEGPSGSAAATVTATEIGDDLRHDEGRQDLAQHGSKLLDQRVRRASQPAAKASAPSPSSVLVRLRSIVLTARRP